LLVLKKDTEKSGVKAFLLSVSFKLFLSLNSEEDEQRRRQEKLRKEEDLQECFHISLDNDDIRNLLLQDDL
jgi:hypothetical protein